jgi:hypothetical protein
VSGVSGQESERISASAEVVAVFTPGDLSGLGIYDACRRRLYRKIAAREKTPARGRRLDA